ncbi:MAG: hypothetical protein H8E73_08875 [Planctomycetes bacterium]|nr:hypothetical protein [Planctomycetota bacterium]MBL7185443.1 hypothetical protein [Phycisphaerae bacterium]
MSNPLPEKFRDCFIRITIWHRLLSIPLFAMLFIGVAVGAGEQVRIDIIERIPNNPQPYRLRDWRAVAFEFDRIAFDSEARGEHLPLVFQMLYGEKKGFGLPCYVGDYRRRKNSTEDRHNESLATLGAVIGATLVGIDKSAGPVNWVTLCEQYYADRPGEGVIVNDPAERPAKSHWYVLFPNILFLALCDLYPDESNVQSIADRVCRRWLEVLCVLTDEGRQPDFDQTGFDFHQMKPVTNDRWIEPDSGAALAWLMHAAYSRSVRQGNSAEAQKYLEAVDWCLRFYEAREKNPAYEILLPFGAYTAARMNAEHNRPYDVRKLLQWVFERSDARPTMIMIADTWEGRDVHGLMGFTKPQNPQAGYAFTMNTFATAWPIVPIARYDDRFARAIGKWMLGAANAARYFYPGEHSPSRQTNPEWRGDVWNAIAYEGLRQKWMRPDEPLTAGGDPMSYGWGPETDLGIYGSSYVGVFGSIVRATNHEKILALDLLATDLYRNEAYPTYLYFNPYSEAKDVAVALGDKPLDLYDAVSDSFLRRNVKGMSFVKVPADTPVVLVLTPAGGLVSVEGAKRLVDDVVIDYRIN